MSLAILFLLLCAQYVSDINMSIFRLRFAGFSLQNEHHQIPAATKTPTHSELRTRRPMW